MERYSLIELQAAATQRQVQTRNQILLQRGALLLVSALLAYLAVSTLMALMRALEAVLAGTRRLSGKGGRDGTARPGARRDEAGEIELVPAEERISGAGTTCIMSAFTHINTYGSRFSNGAYGVYYCALEQDTAVAETVYHRARFLSATKEDAMEIDMRVYLSDLNAALHDLREINDPVLYDLVDYSAGQQLGLQLKNAGSYGAVYRSVRHAGGQCAAVFRPKAFVLDGHQCRQGAHLTYRWDGKTITSVYEKKNFVSL